MVRIEDLLPPECVHRAVSAQSRKRSLDFAADLLAERHPGVDARPLFDALMERERLGSTGIGEGVAIPHCRLECPGMMAAFIRLAEPVDYDAPDGKPVDLLFVLVVPPGENSAHLEVLATLATVFRDPATRDRLRQAGSSEELSATLFNSAARPLARPIHD